MEVDMVIHVLKHELTHITVRNLKFWHNAIQHLKT